MRLEVLALSMLWGFFLMLLAPGSELSAADSLERIPICSPGGIAPQLELRWSTSDPDRFDLLAKLHVTNNTVAFNPFGVPSMGCPYYIAIADSAGQEVGRINKLVPAKAAIPGPDAWMHLGVDRVVGQAYSRRRDLSLADSKVEQIDLSRAREWFLYYNDIEPTPDPVKLKEGEYRLYLLVTKRLESERLFSLIGEGLPGPQQRWGTDELDSVACRSLAVRIRVGEDQKIVRPADSSETPPKPIRVSYKVVDRGLRTEAIMITDRNHMSLDPGLALDSIFGVSVIPPQNAQDPRRLGGYGSASLMANRLTPKRVPRNSIVGYVHNYSGPIVEGRYEIAVKFPKDMWIDDAMDATEAEAIVGIDVTESTFRNRLQPFV